MACTDGVTDTQFRIKCSLVVPIVTITTVTFDLAKFELQLALAPISNNDGVPHYTILYNAESVQCIM